MTDRQDNSTPVGDRPADFGRVAVLLGGTSAEREISLQTGRAVLAALLRRGIDAKALDTTENFISRLSGGEFDCVFVALHGRGGEDGVIQGMLETLGLPYTGSGVLGSALAMDKVRCKWIWQSQGLNTPPFRILAGVEDLDSAAREIGYPMMIKPVHEGSSCGISRVADRQELEQAWCEAGKFDDAVMAEHWIDGAEYTASILDGRVLPLIRLETPRTFYDYDAKYLDDSTRYICPCGLPEAQEAKIAGQALTAFRLIHARSWGRVDLLLDADGTAWLIEVNTIPGMTSHSLVPMAASQAGIDFDELVVRILADSRRMVRK